MKSIHKVILICMILTAVVVEKGIAEVKEQPVSGSSWVLSENEIRELEGKANGRDIEAIRCLFNYYALDHEDAEKALLWAHAGAKFGDSRSKYDLGMMLIDSTDDRKRAEGILALKESANRNYFLAQRVLARYYEYGREVKKSLIEAEKWYRKAAIQGDVWAMVEVAKLLTARGKDVPALSEAYAWAVVILKRTPSEGREAFVDRVHSMQGTITSKGKSLGIKEKQIVSRSNAWVQKEDSKIPLVDPMNVRKPRCTYMNR
jgi:TPR repeat protein